jgi:long-chain fatty acid transport protein
MSRFLARNGAALLLAALALASPSPSRADQYSAFGAGARSVAMAGSGAVLLDDAYAVFANPAGMAFGNPGVTFGFVGGMNRLTTRLSPRPQGYDAPDVGAASPIIPYRYRLSARHPESHAPGFAGFTVGATMGLGLSWLRVGVLAFVPTSGLGNQNTYYSDEREQYFSNSLHYSIYGERLGSQQTLIASSIKPASWLALGVGMRLVMSTRSYNSVMVPSQSDNSVQYMDMRTSTGMDTGPLASIAARFLRQKLRVSLTYRGQVTAGVRGANTVQINGFQGTPQYPYTQPMAAVSEHLPHQVVLSSAYAGPKLRASVDATWSDWSSFRDDHDERAGFHNTINVSAGVEVQVTKATVVRTGAGYRPSPVPNQTGRTNHLDNAMYIFGLGTAYQFLVSGQSLEVGLFGQLQAAVSRTTVKNYSANAPVCGPGVKEICDEIPDDTKHPTTGKPMPEVQGLQTGNPGFPGYSSGGWIAVAGAELTWTYQ